MFSMFNTWLGFEIIFIATHKTFRWICEHKLRDFLSITKQTEQNWQQWENSSQESICLLASLHMYLVLCYTWMSPVKRAISGWCTTNRLLSKKSFNSFIIQQYWSRTSSAVRMSCRPDLCWPFCWLNALFIRCVSGCGEREGAANSSHFWGDQTEGGPVQQRLARLLQNVTGELM